MRKKFRILFLIIGILVLIENSISFENDLGLYEKGRETEDEPDFAINEDDEYAQFQHENSNDEDIDIYSNEILVFVSNDVIINKNSMTFNVDRKHKQNNHTFIKDYIDSFCRVRILEYFLICFLLILIFIK